MKLSLMLILLFCLSSIAAVDETEDNKFGELRKNYKKADQKRKDLKSQIYKSVRVLDKLKSEERDLAERIAKAKRRSSSYESNLDIRAEEIDAKRKEIREVLLTIGKWHKSALGDMIFSASSFNELDKRMFFLKKILDLQVARVKDLKDSVDDFDSKKDSLSQILAKLNNMKSKMAKKRKQLTKIKTFHKNLLTKVSKDQRQAFKKLLKIARTNKMNQLKFFELKGNMPWPVSGPITRLFGNYRDPASKAILTHDDIGISAQDEYVEIIFPGEIAYTGRLESYGLTLIVDHGDNFYSVYSNLAGSMVSEGDSVEQGQKIGRVSMLRGGSLGFGIRHFAEAVNPLEWLQRKELKLANTGKNQGSLER
ncbi:MAG: murein hydrolase activator EnvC [Bdellovibrionales bacterium]